jgi:hypothetical protein
MDSKMELPDTGLYQVCTQIELGCSHCTDTFRVMPRVQQLGSNDLAGFSAVIYPNPNNGVVNIYGILDANWLIQSMDGKQLLSGSGLKVNLESLSPGIYVLRILNIGSVLINKVL